MVSVVALRCNVANLRALSQTEHEEKIKCLRSILSVLDILKREECMEEGLDWMEKPEQSQLCNMQSDGPNVVREGILLSSDSTKCPLRRVFGCHI